VPRLNRQGLHDVVEGAALLGSGGGGTVAVGRQLVDTIWELTDRRGPQVCEDVSALPPDGLVLVAADVGASDTWVPQQDLATLHAAQALAATVRPGGAPAAIVPGEIGPESTLAAIVVAAHLGIPVVDADGAGRAVPTLPLSLFDAGGISASPCAIASTGAEYVVLSAPDATGIEAMMRPLLDLPVFGDSAGMALWAMTPADVARLGLAGTLTRARAVGAALRAARADKTDAVTAALGVTGLSGRVVAQGRARQVQGGDAGGFTASQIVVDGDGGSVTVIGQNENLLVWRADDAQPLVTAPDLLSWLTADGHATTTSELTANGPADGATLLGLHADAPLWAEPVRSRYAAALAGLGYFGPPVPLGKR
jgi:hypothetical protein